MSDRPGKSSTSRVEFTVEASLRKERREGEDGRRNR